MRRYSSGQRGQTVNLLALCLRRFESSPAHKQKKMHPCGAFSFAYVAEDSNSGGGRGTTIGSPCRNERSEFKTEGFEKQAKRARSILPGAQNYKATVLYTRLIFVDY
jgi:hypothetical protein